MKLKDYSKQLRSSGDEMGGMKPPLYYSYQAKEDIIQTLALREYYSSISVFAEIMVFHEKTGNYPKNLVIEYMGHVIHLAAQMAAFEKKFIDRIIELKNEKTQFEMFNVAYKLFKDIQSKMKEKGFLKVSGSFRMSTTAKGEAMALGYG